MPHPQPSGSARDFRLIAAPFTPFTPGGARAPEVIALQARRLMSHQVQGAFICGTTGEGFSLATRERKTVAETWMQHAGDSLKIIVHVGHTCLAESCDLARHAETIGAGAVASIGSCFFAPTSAESLVEMLRHIAGSTSLPFYYYHMPSMTKSPFPASALLPLLLRIPNFAGIKFTHDDLEDFRACVKIGGSDVEMLFGRDEILLEGLRAGASGAVGSTYNYRSDLYREIVQAHDRGDIQTAEALQAKARHFISLFQKYGGLEAGKALMNLCGVPCGPARLPLASLTPEACERMKTEFTQADFFREVKPHASHDADPTRHRETADPLR